MPPSEPASSATDLPAGDDFWRQLRETTGQGPIGEFSPEDIFVVGYPKSGNTWFQNLAAGLAYGVNPEFAPDSLIQELVPDVAYKRAYKRFRTPMFFKSHSLPRPEYRRVLYLLRDGRDVAVSHLHHLAAVSGAVLNEREIAAFIESNAVEWARHVEEWQANPYGAAMLTIRYEDLLGQAPRELRRVCDFAGLERTERFLEELAGQASFARMQRKEAASGWDNPAWPKDKPFVRRGVAGSHRDEMSAELLEIFSARAGATLRRQGY